VVKRSDTVEDYLKAVYQLTAEGGRAGTGEIAALLEVAPASVTDMLQRLDQEEPPLVDYRKHQGAGLTDHGEKVALEILRHHRLLELFLHEVLGYSWDKVHEEAETLEHVISEYFEDRVAEVLGDPDRGIHGEPIPSKALEMPDRTKIYLHDMRPDQKGVIQEVHDDDPGFLRYLKEKGLVPGTPFRVMRFSPYDHIHYLAVAEREDEVAIGESASAQILVEIT
jgi:DtxR family Mn-dependent transcriptional regulator